MRQPAAKVFLMGDLLTGVLMRRRGLVREKDRETSRWVISESDLGRDTNDRTDSMKGHDRNRSGGENGRSRPSI